jgi:hypothetical protein
MNYEDEPYARLYYTDTATWALLGWEGQTVLLHMLRGKFDRAGVFGCGRHEPSRAVTAVTRLPAELVETGLAALLREEVWTVNGDQLIWPKYTYAQTCPRSDRLRQAESRRNRLETALSVIEGETPALSRNVTECHAASHESRTVTLSSSVLSFTDQKNTNVELALDVSGADLDSFAPDPAKLKAAAAARRSEELAVFEAWRVELEHLNAKPNPSRLAKIRARLREGFTVAQLIQAVKNSKNDPFLMGDNPNGKRYDDLESLLRTGTKVEKLLTLSAPLRPKPQHRLELRNDAQDRNADHDTRQRLEASKKVREMLEFSDRMKAGGHV